MSNKSNIQWTDATWNVARGCKKVDEDCKFCYMYRDSFDNTRYNPLEITRTKTVFNLPLKIKEPSRIFTCSLTDFFIEEIDSYRNEAWEIIRKCPQHTFQILTKRPERILANLPEYWDEIKDRCWLGTSVGSQKGIQRAVDLVALRDVASVLFISVEPMHAEVNFNWVNSGDNSTISRCDLLKKIDWVIVGGESGNENGKYRYRECKLEWIEQIVNQCKMEGVAVFVKQFGTYLAKEMKLTDRHGGDIDEFPEHLKIREFPNGKILPEPIIN